MNIPIELFLGFIGTAIVLAIIGFIRNPQLPVLTVACGIFMLAISVVTTSITFTNSDILSSISIESNETKIYDIVTSDQMNVFTSTLNARGQWVNEASSILIGEQFTCMSVPIIKSGSPVGTVSLGVMRNSTGNNMFLEFGSFDASTLTTNAVYHKFCLDNNEVYEIQLNDIIGVRHLNSTVTDRISTFSIGSGSTYDGTASNIGSFSVGVWVETGSRDYVMTLTRGEDKIETTNTITTQSYEFTNLPKVIFALLASIFMLVGGLMVFRE